MEKYHDPLEKMLNAPKPRLFLKAYEEPPSPTNPVLRGLALYYGGSLIASVDAISRYLWANAGFTVLRKIPEIRDFPPRFDPTVIPGQRPAASGISREIEDVLTLRKPTGDVDKRFPSVVDYHQAYRSGIFTPTAVVEALLPLVRRDVSKPTQHSTAFLETSVEQVRTAAEKSTARWKSGSPLGLLDGIPICVKDEIDIEGYKKTYGSNEVFKTEGTNWCVQALIDEGAIIIGKSTMHELGADTCTNNPVHGTPLNPYCQDYYCGGSSGGSAYATAAGLVPVAVGTDAGGSIRIPASFCGVYGLKTSHGRVSNHPAKDTALSVCVTGPIAANMVDLEVAVRAMAKPDPRDQSSSRFPVPGVASISSKSRVMGIYKPWFDRADTTVRSACEASIRYMRDTLGYTVVDITIPFLHEAQSAHALTCLTELAENYSKPVSDLTPGNKLLISVGKQTPGTDYILAQRLRELLMRHLAALFQEHPGLIIVTPTTPLAGWPIEIADLKYGVSDANTSTRNMEYVWLANFSGCPSLQGPVGYKDLGDKGSIPIGMMGMGQWGADEEVISWGYDLERWLNEGLENGRKKPKNWVNVFSIAGPQ